MRILDDKEGMKKMDSLGVLRVIERFPETCEKGMSLGENFARKVKKKRPKKIVFSGMGGSAIIGDIIKGMFPEKEMIVVRDYDLPEQIDKQWLIISVSYSGNTEETLSAFEQAIGRKMDAIGITSGGSLGRLLKKHKKRGIKVPSGVPPRYAAGYMLFSVLSFLKKTGFVKTDTDLKGVIRDLKETREEIKPENPIKNNISKRIAYKLMHTIPIIQSIGEYKAIAYRGKTQFNENTKIPSYTETYPELNHNSLLNWEKPNHLTKRFSFLIIRDEDENKQIRKRIEFTKMLLRRSCDSITELWSFFPSRISRMLSVMYILDFVTVYLAFLYRNDPGKDDLLGDLKNYLKKD